MTATIRKEQENDIDAIGRINLAAFQTIEHSSQTEHFIVNALRGRGELTVSLVAVENDQIIGHVALSPVLIADGSESWFGLGPVAVLPGCQRKGVGSLLITEALAELQSLQPSGCVVIGDPYFYSRFGFVAEPRLFLADVPAEYFQVLLIKGELPEGEVRYSKAFEAQK